MTEYDSETGRSDKIAISLPKGSKAALQAMVDAGRAPSVSAIIAEALAGYTSTEEQRQRTRQRIAELREGKPLPADALAWARQALGVDAPAAGAGAA